MKRGAIYIRVSSDEAKREGYSPKTQEEKVKEFFKTNGIQWSEKHIYRDLGFSGGTQDRPEFKRLMRNAENKEFDVIVVYRLDRFFRNLRSLINTAYKLEKLGIGLKSVTEPFDTSTPTGRATLYLMGTMAEWQREVTLEAKEEGTKRAIKEGKWVLGGVAPFGYKYDHKTQRLVINEEEAKIVKMLFRWLTEERLTIYEIQKRVNEMRIPTKFDRLGKRKKSKSKGWWNRRTIQRILTREAYTGTFYMRKYKNPQRSYTQENTNPKEQWIPIKIPAIISKELFARAQRQLRENKELSPKKTKMLYPFRHKLVCGIDRRRYIACYMPYKTKGGIKLYVCAGRRHSLSPHKCPAPAIIEPRILPPVWENLTRLLTNPDFVFHTLEKYTNQQDKEQEIRKKFSEIEKRLKFYKRKERKLAELYSSGMIDMDIYQEEWNRCKKDETLVLEEKEKVSQLLLTQQEKEERVGSIKRLYHQLKNQLKNPTYEVQCKLIQLLINKIVVKGENLEIEYDLPLNVARPELKKSLSNALQAALPTSYHTPGYNRRIDCRHKTFNIVLTAKLLPRSRYRNWV